MKVSIVDNDKGTIKIFGDGEWIELEYDIPEWNEDDEYADYESCFIFNDNKYFLSEFMSVDKHSPFYGIFHGYSNDSFFSGVGVKLSDDGDVIKVYSFSS